MKKEYQFSIEMKTRDYECDIQGVVNNANYLHYLEVTRHEFLEQVGVTFSSLHNKDIDLMVSHIGIDYKHSLHGGERFRSCLSLHREGVRYVFEQDLYHLPSEQLAIKARVECVCLVNGTLTRGDEVAPLFAAYLSPTV